MLLGLLHKVDGYQSGEQELREQNTKTVLEEAGSSIEVQRKATVFLVTVCVCSENRRLNA